MKIKPVEQAKGIIAVVSANKRKIFRQCQKVRREETGGHLCEEGTKAWTQWLKTSFPTTPCAYFKMLRVCRAEPQSKASIYQKMHI